MKITRNRFVKRTLGWSAMVGLNPYQLATLRRVPQFLREKRLYGKQSEGTPFALGTGPQAAILTDYDGPAGIARGHYFHQDLWAARRVFAQRPARHVDIGSRIDGFAAHVLTFMPLTIIDIRPMDSPVEGLTFQQGDATNLSSIPDGTIESLSMLHALEHIGLGRYRDAIDANGWKLAAGELVRVLAPGGRLYLSVPIGRERVEFNSHRVFAPRTIIDAFGALRLVAFHAVDDSERMRMNPDPSEFDAAAFSCGLFEFTKPPAA